MRYHGKRKLRTDTEGADEGGRQSERLHPKQKILQASSLSAMASPWNPPLTGLHRAQLTHHWRAHSGRLAASGECHQGNVGGACPTHPPSGLGTELPITKLGIPCPLAFTWAPAMTDVGPAFQPAADMGFTGSGWHGAAMVLRHYVFSITEASTFVACSVSKPFLLRSFPVVSLPWH